MSRIIVSDIIRALLLKEDEILPYHLEMLYPFLSGDDRKEGVAIPFYFLLEALDLPVNIPRIATLVDELALQDNAKLERELEDLFIRLLKFPGGISLLAID